jgi:hypothetical protein
MTIGCHSRTHPMLTAVGVNLHAEVETSREDIERNLGTYPRPVRVSLRRVGTLASLTPYARPAIGQPGISRRSVEYCKGSLRASRRAGDRRHDVRARGRRSVRAMGNENRRPSSDTTSTFRPERTSPRDVSRRTQVVVKTEVGRGSAHPSSAATRLTWMRVGRSPRSPLRSVCHEALRPAIAAARTTRDGIFSMAAGA